MSDHHDAAELAADAGAILLEVRRHLGDDLGGRGDRGSHDYLMAELARRHPGDAVLSEEGVDDPARLTADRVWIIDPLDGTREFTEVPRDDWAVHVALWERGREITAAAVAMPARDLVLSTAAPPSAPPAVGDRALRLVVSRTRPPVVAEKVAAGLGAELVPLGSAGAKTMAVVLGDVDAYVHAGGQYEWDSAAPVGVAAAAGLHTSRLDGAPLRYNQRDPLLPDLLVCRPELAARIIDLVGDEVR